LKSLGFDGLFCASDPTSKASRGPGGFSAAVDRRRHWAVFLFRPWQKYYGKQIILSAVGVTLLDASAFALSSFHGMKIQNASARSQLRRENSYTRRCQQPAGRPSGQRSMRGQPGIQHPRGRARISSARTVGLFDPATKSPRTAAARNSPFAPAHCSKHPRTGFRSAPCSARWQPVFTRPRTVRQCPSCPYALLSEVFLTATNRRPCLGLVRAATIWPAFVILLIAFPNIFYAADAACGSTCWIASVRRPPADRDRRSGPSRGRGANRSLTQQTHPPTAAPAAMRLPPASTPPSHARTEGSARVPRSKKIPTAALHQPGHYRGATRTSRSRLSLPPRLLFCAG